MEIIRRKLLNKWNIPDVLTDILHNNNFVIFDIETTGLNSKYNQVILIGMLYLEDNYIILEQLFCNNSSDEHKLLETFKDKLHNFDLYITYNGNNFDIPFLNKRFIKNNMKFQIDSYLNFDLLQIIKKNKKKLGLKNCKLKTIEKFLGIIRSDTIDGADSVNLYKTYEITQDDSLKKKILLHNFEDILHLIPTLKILNYFNKSEILHYIPNELDITTGLKIRILDYSIKNDYLHINGKCIGELDKEFIFYYPEYSFILSNEDMKFELTVPVIRIIISNNKCYTYININELHFINQNLCDLNHKERNKFLIGIDNNILLENLYNFTKSFVTDVLDSINL